VTLGRELIQDALYRNHFNSRSSGRLRTILPVTNLKTVAKFFRVANSDLVVYTNGVCLAAIQTVYYKMRVFLH
jgi:hypothetical protein